MKPPARQRPRGRRLAGDGAHTTIQSFVERQGRRYLRDDVGAVLRLLADRLDPPEGSDGGRPKPSSLADQTGQTQTFGDEEDWESNTDVVKQCILAGDKVLVAWFLRDLSDLVRDLGSAIGPHGNIEELELRFVRRRRGKPRDPAMQQMLKESKESGMRTEVISETRRLGKQEAAVHAMMTKTGKSRASIFRVLAKGKQSHKKPNK